MSSFAFRQAVRETRASWRRVGLYMSSITLGVAALVAINSFRANVQDSVGASGQELLGADLRLHASAPFKPRIDVILDSMARTGHAIDRSVNAVSMVYAPRTGLTRLVQVRGTGPLLPFYGQYVTEPASAWATFRPRDGAVVDPAVLLQLGLRLGDTLRIGLTAVPVLGTLQSGGGEVNLQASLAPRVFVSLGTLQRAGLLGFGALARYEAYLKVPAARDRKAFDARYRPTLRSNGVGINSAEGMAAGVTEALDFLSKFLGLVGLAALLLGGVGVASAIHVFIKGRLDTVAVLRCLGATQRDVFAAYLLQSAFLGLAGAAAGAVLGVGVQALLPGILKPFMVVQVPFALEPAAILAGLATGGWVAGIFAFIPLLGVRDVAPLQALRHDYEPPRRRFDWRRSLAYLLLTGSLVALSIWQAPNLLTGLAFAGALTLVGVILWLIALGLVHGTRRFFPERARYVVRQGISNLFRPHNQTAAVTLSLGFGIFLVATLYLVHGAIIDRITIGGGGERANLLMFDIQPGQVQGVRAILARHRIPLHDITPIVSARIAAINGRTIEDLLATRAGQDPDEPQAADSAERRSASDGRARGGAGRARRDSAQARRPHGWALRREYRNTYRDTLVGTERLTAGKWWPRGSRAGSVPLISLDEGLARDLGVGLGDTITWNFNGVTIPSVVASLRSVQWARFSPNFFVVFQPGAIEDAPQTEIALARVTGGDSTLARVQGEIVRTYPNVSSIDLSLVQRTLDSIVGKVTMAVRFLALFSLGAGLIVLVGALATSRFQRVRESALLKTLGATRRQVLQVLLTEYAALGLLAGLAGTLLALAGGWALVHFFFKFPFRPPLLPLAASWIAAAVLTSGVGLLNSRDVLRRPPLAVLRDEASSV